MQKQYVAYGVPCHTQMARCVVLAVIVIGAALRFMDGSLPAWAAEVRSPCAIHHPSDRRIAWHCRRLQKQETLETLFGPRWIDVARFNRIDRRHAQPGREIKVPVRVEEVVNFTPLPSLYPAGEQERQLIVVDLAEQFLGAYEYGVLRFSFPIASGESENETPTGKFRITAAHRTHRSCLYTIESTTIPYPMQYALRFFVNADGVSYWIHGRDLPGYPASHGCIGLADEHMQLHYYGVPAQPELADAKKLYEWVLGDLTDSGEVLSLASGPAVWIEGITPKSKVSAQSSP